MLTPYITLPGLIGEATTRDILIGTGVRESIRTLIVLGRLVRVVNRHGVYYTVNDVRSVVMSFARDVTPAWKVA